MTDIDVGDPAPTIELTDDTGKPWSTTGHPGRHVVLIFHRHFY